MKKTVLYLACFIAVAFLLSSCSGLKKMKKNAGLITYTVTPEVLEMHADSVAVNISGKFPAKYFKKKITCDITPVIKYANGEKALKMVSVQGEKVTANNTVVSYLNGGSFSYNDKVAYSEDMRISTLEVRIKGKAKKKELDFDPKEIAKGVKATPGLLMINPRPIYGKDKFVRIVPETKEADVLYLINQANLQGKELTQDDIKSLKDYIKKTKENKRKEIKGVDISSYASPDGTIEINSKLADNRGKTAEKFMGDEFKKFDKAKEQGFFKSANTPEDWDGFQKLMASSDLADKDLILRVLSMYTDPIVREKEIKNMAATYKIVADKILPKLRRSVMTVNVDSIGHSDEEINQIFDSNPQGLTVEELVYAGTLTKDLNRLQKIYQACSDIYPTDWRGHNNLAAVYILQLKSAEARTAAEKAKKIEASNTIILNNLGAVTLLEKDFIKAAELLTSANGAGPEVNYNLGICCIKKADYPGAVKYFGSDCSFNAGLAKLLNGDNDGAIKAVDCAPDKDEAMMFYLKAVSGARQGNTDILFNNLRAAVSKDAKLAGFAKTDMEFGKYFEDDTFKTIVK